MWTRFVRLFRADTREAELDVLRDLLPGPDERHSLLLAQFERARSIRRERPSSDIYRAGPASTTDDLTFPLELGSIASDWNEYATHRGKRVRFRVVVRMGGFLEWLEGVTVDGSSFPDDWAPARRVAAEVLSLVLPSRSSQDAIIAKARRRLAIWLGLAKTRVATVRVRAPATDARIREAERAGGFRIPFELRRFLRISDGIEAGWMRLHGCDELYLLDEVGVGGVVVAWDADAEDDVVVIVDPSGSDPAVYALRVHDDQPTRRLIAPTYCEYVRLIVSR